MTRRRSFIKRAAAAGTGLLAGCTGGSSSGSSFKKTLQVTTPFSSNHPLIDTVKNHSSDLSEQTDGRLDMEIASIGGEEDMIDATSSGSIDMMFTSLNSFTQAFGPEFGFLGTPFVPEGWDHLKRMWEEWAIGDEGLGAQAIDQGGMRILGTCHIGENWWHCKKKVTHPDDAEGMSLRLPQFETWIDVFEGMGVDVTPIAWDELYQSIETGVVEGSINPPASYESASLYEVTTHFNGVRPLLLQYVHGINNETFESMSDDDKEVIINTAESMNQFVIEEIESSSQESLEFIRNETDVTVVPPSEVDMGAFQEAVAPTLSSMFEDRFEPSLDEVRSLA